MSNTTYKKDIFIFFGLLMLSVFFRWVTEHLLILQYIWLLWIRWAVMVFLQRYISQHQKESIRAYGVVLLSILLVCFTVYGFLSTNRLLMGSMRYICFTILRALDTKFWQCMSRWSSHVAYHDILYLFTVASTFVISVHFYVGIQEERMFLLTTVMLLILLLGNRLLWCSRWYMFKQIKIWLLLLVWSILALWQIIELFLPN